MRRETIIHNRKSTAPCLNPSQTLATACWETDGLLPHSVMEGVSQEQWGLEAPQVMNCLVFIYLSSTLPPHSFITAFFPASILALANLQSSNLGSNGPDREMGLEHWFLNDVNIKDKLLSICFSHFFAPHKSNSECLAMHTAEHGGSAALAALSSLQLLQDFPMFISLALDFVTHATAACWYHTTVPAYCTPVFHYADQEQRQC